MNQRIQLSDHFTTSRILRFAASPIIMMVFTSIYSVVDGFFVSNFAVTHSRALSYLNALTVQLCKLCKGILIQALQDLCHRLDLLYKTTDLTSHQRTVLCIAI